MTCWSAYAIPPGLAQAPVCTWEIWLELGAMPVSLIVTVNEPVPLTTLPVPATPLAFCEVIVKLMEGVGDVGLVAVEPVPPQAARTNNPASAKTRLRIRASFVTGALVQSALPLWVTSVLGRVVRHGGRWRPKRPLCGRFGHEPAVVSALRRGAAGPRLELGFGSP